MCQNKLSRIIRFATPLNMDTRAVCMAVEEQQGVNPLQLYLRMFRNWPRRARMNVNIFQVDPELPVVVIVACVGGYGRKAASLWFTLTHIG